MFQTDRDYVFDQPVIDSSSTEYRIGVNDVLTFEVYSNQGSLMLQYTTSDIERPGTLRSPDFSYTVDVEGYVEFPVVGRKYVVGYTIQELQTYLEQLYAFQFNEPMVILKIVNRRCLVFNGTGGQGAVIPLSNIGISVIEAVALAGGIGARGDASQIKIIREVNSKQEVYMIDLSTIEGIKYANMSVQSGDIIYVQPNPNLAREALNDIQPIVGVLSGIAVIYGIFARLF